MAITASMIKELRDRTGIGMTKCKTALEEASGDVNLAIENLRKSGAASAVKKEGREAKEGLIAIAKTDSAVALVEVNAETDFVINNDRFKSFLADVAEEAAKSKPTSTEAFLQQTSSKNGSTIEELRAELVQAIGENIQIRRVKIFEKQSGKSIGIYQHLGGKIAVVVEIEGQDEEALASDIAMHSAAAAPEFIRPEEIPAEVIEKEREIARSQMEGKKPDNIIGKIVEGKLKAYYNDVCLLQQKFVKDEGLTIAQLLETKGKEAGKELSVAGFTRWAVGQN
ncbi:Elongation factor Ts [Chlamydiales bacterium SCGC AG-110-P3]|nr:Elongation factor Ts [Chlamydiales bacterium SCGC AG-110-P3]